MVDPIKLIRIGGFDEKHPFYYQSPGKEWL